LPSQKLKKRRRSVAVDDDILSDSDGGDFGTNDRASRLLRSTGVVPSARAVAILGKSSLAPGVIDIRRVTDANKRDPNRAVIQALEFHPSGRLVMTAGLDRTMRIFHVDGKRNSKVQGIHLQDLPITSAHFTGGGSEVVLTGRRAFFYQFDLGSGEAVRVDTLSRGRNAMKSLEECIASPDGSQFAFIGGKGRVILVSNKSKQQTGVLRMDVPCSAATFSRHNEHHVLTTGKGGAVYLWDVRKHACVDRHIDEGALVGTAISTSVSHYAIGSSTGVVNVYRQGAMRGEGDNTISRSGDRREQPDHTFMNLTTGISALTFNKDGQILAMASRALKNAVRLVHVPTMSVYSNWPTQNVNLKRVSRLAFSPSGGFLAAGNDKGEALLFRLRNGYDAF
jgi:U3 small nucleolar RNA-associated protein 18